VYIFPFQPDQLADSQASHYACVNHGCVGLAYKVYESSNCSGVTWGFVRFPIRGVGICTPMSGFFASSPNLNALLRTLASASFTFIAVAWFSRDH